MFSSGPLFLYVSFNSYCVNTHKHTRTQQNDCSTRTTKWSIIIHREAFILHQPFHFIWPHINYRLRSDEWHEHSIPLCIITDHAEHSWIFIAIEGGGTYVHQLHCKMKTFASIYFERDSSRPITLFVTSVTSLYVMALEVGSQGLSGAQR